MNEGGQSSTGQLIDFMVTTHPAYPKLLKLAEQTQKSWFDILAERLESMRVEKGVPTASEFCLPRRGRAGEADGQRI